MAQRKKRVNQTKIIVDGITFQSTLESKQYIMLRDAGIKFTYEGKQYTTMQDSEYTGEVWERHNKRSKGLTLRPKIIGVRYTPDFIAEDESWFIEVKGRNNANESFPMTWKKPPIIFKPMNVSDCKQVVEILLSKGYGPKQK